MVYKVYNSNAVITLDELPAFGSGTPTPTPTPNPTLTPTPTSTPTPTLTPTPTPTSGPTATPSPTPTITPTVTPSVIPTMSPTPTPTPTGSITLSLTNTGNGNASTNTIKNNIKITHVSGSDLDLSKLTIRYYYTKEGSASENFYCDSAAVQMNKSPWYVSYVNYISGITKSMSSVKTNADSYIEIKLTTTDVFSAGSTLTIDTRLSKSDWSVYNQTNDYSYNDNTHITVYYDGTLILGTEP